MRQSDDVGRAEERVEDLNAALAELDRRFQDEVSGLERGADAPTLPLEVRELPPRKSDLAAEVILVWTPHWVGADGSVEPAFG